MVGAMPKLGIRLGTNYTPDKLRTVESGTDLLSVQVL